MELQAVLGALHDAGVLPLILKGTALAYCLYPAPHERPRIDTDLFLRHEDVDRAWEVFRARGYARAAQNTGRLVSHQFACARTDEHGVWHAFDLHWKLANPQVFANLIGYDLLDSTRGAVPALGPHARVPSPVDLPLLAFVQHRSDPRHLSRVIAANNVVSAAFMVGAAGAGIGLRALGFTIPQLFLYTAILNTIVCVYIFTVIPEFLMRFIIWMLVHTVYRVSQRGLDNLLVDLRQLPGWRDRLRLIVEHAFLRRKHAVALQHHAAPAPGALRAPAGQRRLALGSSRMTVRTIPAGKRALDILLAGAGLVGSSPLWLLLATVIKLEDGGPVFYSQERVGEGGRVFRAFKFRSMIPDAERNVGALQAGANDSRVTRVGRLMRATAMDELPQLWSIFRGDMSFVGRARSAGEIEATGDGRFEALEDVPGYEERHSVRPGLTGIAQIYARATSSDGTSSATTASTSASPVSGSTSA